MKSNIRLWLFYNSTYGKYQKTHKLRRKMFRRLRDWHVTDSKVITMDIVSAYPLGI
jgi:hypothetical protein